MPRLGAFPLIVLSLVALLPAPVMAQPAPPPERTINLLVYGDDPCPQGKGDEIVVCARRPESERYRIPKKLREKPAPSGGPGWGSQVATMEATQRQNLPNSCSVNGAGGFTGCTAQMLSQWFAERRMQQSTGTP